MSRHRAPRRAVRTARLVLAAAAVAGAVLVLSDLDDRSPVEAAAAAAAAPPSVALEATTRPDAPAPTRVQIPSLGVDSALTRLGIDAAGALVPPEDFTLAGWFTGGPAPGEVGPAVIAGHVDSRTGPAVFFRLDEVAVGNEVLVDRADGTHAHLRRHGGGPVREGRLPDARGLRPDAGCGAPADHLRRGVRPGGTQLSRQRRRLRETDPPDGLAPISPGPPAGGVPVPTAVGGGVGVPGLQVRVAGVGRPGHHVRRARTDLLVTAGTAVALAGRRAPRAGARPSRRPVPPRRPPAGGPGQRRRDASRSGDADGAPAVSGTRARGTRGRSSAPGSPR